MHDERERESKFKWFYFIHYSNKVSCLLKSRSFHLQSLWKSPGRVSIIRVHDVLCPSVACVWFLSSELALLLYTANRTNTRRVECIERDFPLVGNLTLWVWKRLFSSCGLCVCVCVSKWVNVYPVTS